MNTTLLVDDDNIRVDRSPSTLTTGMSSSPDTETLLPSPEIASVVGPQLKPQQQPVSSLVIGVGTPLQDFSRIGNSLPIELDKLEGSPSILHCLVNPFAETILQ